MTVSISHLLNRSCEITPVSVGAASGDGGFATTEGAAVPVTCRIRPLSAAEVTQLERREIRASHVVYLDPDTVVGRGDLIDLQDAFLPTETLTVQEVQIPSIPDTFLKVMVSSGQRSN